MPTRNGLAQEVLPFRNSGRDDPRHAPAFRHRCRQHRETLGGGPVDQILPVQVQDVEHERAQRQRRPQALHVEPTAEATRADLKRMRSAVRLQGERLAVQDHGRHPQRLGHLDQLRYATGDVVQTTGEDAYLLAPHVDLDSGPVELPLDRRGRNPLERLGHRRG